MKFNTLELRPLHLEDEASFRDASDPSNLGYLEAVEQCTQELNIPIVYDADIGHKPPNMTLINGALAELSMDHGKATLTHSLV
jgi:muramoyltetrapeptide carboxypeptidase LdcA involved in peptidoglycan recycling